MSWWKKVFVLVCGAMSSLWGDETAIFAGGCFWCMQHDFDQVPGVISTTAGYTGGDKVSPTYEDVSTGTTGHVEAVEVVYDPDKVTYQDLLDVYWHNIDPLRSDGQFCDIGSEYRPMIFTTTPEQQKLAQDYKTKLIEDKTFKTPILVEIAPAKAFCPAEDYHQEYWKKNSIRYKFYRYNCGRDKRLKELWDR